MSSKEIYADLASKAISKRYVFGRKQYVVHADDFDKYRDHFAETRNILNPKQNLRTKDVFKHIHAIGFSDVVEFHWDFGNLYQRSIMAVPHLFIDVIPFFLYHLVLFKKPSPWREEPIYDLTVDNSSLAV